MDDETQKAWAVVAYSQGLQTSGVARLLGVSVNVIEFWKGVDANFRESVSAAEAWSESDIIGKLRKAMAHVSAKD